MAIIDTLKIQAKPHHTQPYFQKPTLPRQCKATAHQCQIHYDQIAGYSQKIIKQGSSLPQMFADFAEIPAPGTPNGHYVVAVKLWSAMSLGTVTVTLDTLKVDGATPKI